jgi:hypothetical protein
MSFACNTNNERSATALDSCSDSYSVSVDVPHCSEHVICEPHTVDSFAGSSQLSHQPPPQSTPSQRITPVYGSGVGLKSVEDSVR